MKRKSRGYIQLTPRDFKIFQSLWKWKLGTTAALGHEFFGSATSDAAYQRLRKLLQYEYVDLIPIPNLVGSVWVLLKRGFDTVKEFLPGRWQNGFESETLHHDYWCTALQRGPAIHIPETMEMFSEQELRCVDSGLFPDWVPNSQIHRPDGATRLPVNGKLATVVFEVELNRKKDHMYQRLASFFANYDSIFRVVWMTKNKADANFIQSQIREARPGGYLKHLFIELQDFREKLWQAPILLGREESKPISILLERGLSPTVLQGETPPILDINKRPYRSNIYRLSKKDQFCDRVGFSPTLSPLVTNTTERT